MIELRKGNCFYNGEPTLNAETTLFNNMHEALIKLAELTKGKNIGLLPCGGIEIKDSLSSTYNTKYYLRESE